MRNSGWPLATRAPASMTELMPRVEFSRGRHRRAALGIAVRHRAGGQKSDVQVTLGDTTIDGLASDRGSLRATNHDASRRPTTTVNP